MELLIIALAVTGWMTEVIQDGRTDRAYAKKGQVSPRHQVRLARLEKAGRPVSPKSRGPLRNYMSELWADAVLDLSDKHRSKREHRGPVVYDPDKPKLRQRAAGVADRFDAAVLGGIRRVQESQGWDRTKAAAVTVGRKLVDPVGFTDREAADVAGLPGEAADGPECGWCQDSGVVNDQPCSQCQPQPLRYYDSSPARPKVGTREDGMEWTGEMWTVVCLRCDLPMAGRDDRGWLVCEHCGVRGVDNRPERYYHVHLSNGYTEGGWTINAGSVGEAEAEARRIYADQGGIRGGLYRFGDTGERIDLCDLANTQNEADQTESPSGGPTMTGTIGEASTYETAVPALGDLQEAMNNLSDEVAGAEEAADNFVAHVEGIDEAKTQVAAAAAAVQEQMAAAGVSGGSMEQVTAAMEQVQQGDLAAAMDFIGQARQQLTDAKTAASEAAGAAGQAQQDLQDELGEAHERVASNLSGNGEFLNSGGGVPVGAGR